MGMIVSVYRDADSTYDCSNGGLSSLFTRLTVVNVEGPFDPTADRPAVMLVPGNLPGTVKLVPAENVGTDEEPFYIPLPTNTAEYAGPMFGGNFAATSDSRWFRAIEKLTGGRGSGAIDIHDRVESWAVNERLSR